MSRAGGGGGEKPPDPSSSKRTVQLPTPSRISISDLATRRLESSLYSRVALKESASSHRSLEKTAREERNSSKNNNDNDSKSVNEEERDWQIRRLLAHGSREVRNLLAELQLQEGELLGVRAEISQKKITDDESDKSGRRKGRGVDDEEESSSPRTPQGLFPSSSTPASKMLARLTTARTTTRDEEHNPARSLSLKDLDDIDDDDIVESPTKGPTTTTASPKPLSDSNYVNIEEEFPISPLSPPSPVSLCPRPACVQQRRAAAAAAVRISSEKAKWTAELTRVRAAVGETSYRAATLAKQNGAMWERMQFATCEVGGVENLLHSLRHAVVAALQHELEKKAEAEGRCARLVVAKAAHSQSMEQLENRMMKNTAFFRSSRKRAISLCCRIQAIQGGIIKTSFLGWRQQCGSGRRYAMKMRNALVDSFALSVLCRPVLSAWQEEVKERIEIKRAYLQQWRSIVARILIIRQVLSQENIFRRWRALVQRQRQFQRVGRLSSWESRCLRQILVAWHNFSKKAKVTRFFFSILQLAGSSLASQRRTLAFLSKPKRKPNNNNNYHNLASSMVSSPMPSASFFSVPSMDDETIRQEEYQGRTKSRLDASAIVETSILSGVSATVAAAMSPFTFAPPASSSATTNRRRQQTALPPPSFLISPIVPFDMTIATPAAAAIPSSLSSTSPQPPSPPPRAISLACFVINRQHVRICRRLFHAWSEFVFATCRPIAKQIDRAFQQKQKMLIGNVFNAWRVTSRKKRGQAVKVSHRLVVRSSHRLWNIVSRWRDYAHRRWNAKRLERKQNTRLCLHILSEWITLVSSSRVELVQTWQQISSEHQLIKKAALSKWRETIVERKSEAKQVWKAVHWCYRRLLHRCFLSWRHRFVVLHRQEIRKLSFLSRVVLGRYFTLWRRQWAAVKQRREIQHKVWTCHHSVQKVKRLTKGSLDFWKDFVEQRKLYRREEEQKGVVASLFIAAMRLSPGEKKGVESKKADNVAPTKKQLAAVVFQHLLAKSKSKNDALFDDEEFSDDDSFSHRRRIPNLSEKCQVIETQLFQRKVCNEWRKIVVEKRRLNVCHYRLERKIVPSHLKTSTFREWKRLTLFSALILAEPQHRKQVDAMQTLAHRRYRDQMVRRVFSLMLHQRTLRKRKVELAEKHFNRSLQRKFFGLMIGVCIFDGRSQQVAMLENRIATVSAVKIISTNKKSRIVSRWRKWTRGRIHYRKVLLPRLLNTIFGEWHKFCAKKRHYASARIALTFSKRQWQQQFVRLVLQTWCRFAWRKRYCRNISRHLNNSLRVYSRVLKIAFSCWKKQLSSQKFARKTQQVGVHRIRQQSLRRNFASWKYIVKVVKHQRQGVLSRACFQWILNAKKEEVEYRRDLERILFMGRYFSQWSQLTTNNNNLWNAGLSKNVKRKRVKNIWSLVESISHRHYCRHLLRSVLQHWQVFAARRNLVDQLFLLKSSQKSEEGRRRGAVSSSLLKFALFFLRKHDRTLQRVFQEWRAASRFVAQRSAKLVGCKAKMRNRRLCLVFSAMTRFSLVGKRIKSSTVQHRRALIIAGWRGFLEAVFRQRTVRKIQRKRRFAVLKTNFSGWVCAIRYQVFTNHREQSRRSAVNFRTAKVVFNSWRQIVERNRLVEVMFRRRCVFARITQSFDAWKLLVASRIDNEDRLSLVACNHILFRRRFSKVLTSWLGQVHSTNSLVERFFWSNLYKRRMSLFFWAWRRRSQNIRISEALSLRSRKSQLLRLWRQNLVPRSKARMANVVKCCGFMTSHVNIHLVGKALVHWADWTRASVYHSRYCLVRYFAFWKSTHLADMQWETSKRRRLHWILLFWHERAERNLDYTRRFKQLLSQSAQRKLALTVLKWHSQVLFSKRCGRICEEIKKIRSRNFEKRIGLILSRWRSRVVSRKELTAIHGEVRQLLAQNMQQRIASFIEKWRLRAGWKKGQEQVHDEIKERSNKRKLSIIVSKWRLRAVLKKRQGDICTEIKQIRSRNMQQRLGLLLSRWHSRVVSRKELMMIHRDVRQMLAQNMQQRLGLLLSRWRSRVVSRKELRVIHDQVRQILAQQRLALIVTRWRLRAGWKKEREEIHDEIKERSVARTLRAVVSIWRSRVLSKKQHGEIAEEIKQLSAQSLRQKLSLLLVRWRLRAASNKQLHGKREQIREKNSRRKLTRIVSKWRLRATSKKRLMRIHSQVVARSSCYLFPGGRLPLLKTCFDHWARLHAIHRHIREQNLSLCEAVLSAWKQKTSVRRVLTIFSGRHTQKSTERFLSDFFHQWVVFAKVAKIQIHRRQLLLASTFRLWSKTCKLYLCVKNIQQRVFKCWKVEYFSSWMECTKKSRHHGMRLHHANSRRYRRILLKSLHAWNVVAQYQHRLKWNYSKIQARFFFARFFADWKMVTFWQRLAKRWIKGEEGRISTNVLSNNCFDRLVSLLRNRSWRQRMYLVRPIFQEWMEFAIERRMNRSKSSRAENHRNSSLMRLGFAAFILIRIDRQRLNRRLLHNHFRLWCKYIGQSREIAKAALILGFESKHALALLRIFFEQWRQNVEARAVQESVLYRRGCRRMCLARFWAAIVSWFHHQKQLKDLSQSVVLQYRTRQVVMIVTSWRTLCARTSLVNRLRGRCLVALVSNILANWRLQCETMRMSKKIVSVSMAKMHQRQKRECIRDWSLFIRRRKISAKVFTSLKGEERSLREKLSTEQEKVEALRVSVTKEAQLCSQKVEELCQAVHGRVYSDQAKYVEVKTQHEKDKQTLAALRAIVHTKERKDNDVTQLRNRVAELESSSLELSRSLREERANSVRYMSAAREKDSSNAAAAIPPALTMEFTMLNLLSPGLGLAFSRDFRGVTTVSDIARGSSAERCGMIWVGDELTHFGSTPVSQMSLEELYNTARQGYPGSTVSIVLNRQTSSAGQIEVNLLRGMAVPPSSTTESDKGSLMVQQLRSLRNENDWLSKLLQTLARRERELSTITANFRTGK